MLLDGVHGSGVSRLSSSSHTPMLTSRCPLLILTPVHSQILMADDKELNQWASLRKAVRLRSADEERKDRARYKKKAKDAVRDIGSVAWS